MSRRARDRNFFFTVNLLQNVIFCVITFLVASCAVPTSNEKAKTTLNDWCECMREHTQLGEQAHQICTEKYKKEISSVMMQKSQDVEKDTILSLSAKMIQNDTILMKKRIKEFENMGQLLRELSKKCLEDI
jgi:hypothetical protein